MTSVVLLFLLVKYGKEGKQLVENEGADLKFSLIFK